MDRIVLIVALSVTTLLAAAPVVVVSPAYAEQLNLDAKDLVVEARIKRTGEVMAFGFDAIWVAENGVLTRVNPDDNSVTDIPLPGRVGRYRGVAVGEGAVWVPDTVNEAILKVDPALNQIVMQIDVELENRWGSIGVGEGSVWVTTQGGGKAWLARYSATTGLEQARIPLPPSGAGVLVDFGSVWVTGTYKREVYRVDAATNSLVATIKASGNPMFLTSAFGTIWIVNEKDATVQRIDPATNEVVATIETGVVDTKLGDATGGDGYVWASFGGASLVQIDPATNAIVRMYRGTGLGHFVRYGAGSLWLVGMSIDRIAVPQ